MNIHSVKHTVTDILLNDSRARDDDLYLYRKVIERTKPEMLKMSFGFALDNIARAGLPGFETVRRARQKAQEHDIRLASSRVTRKARDEKQKEFYDFAKGAGR